MFSIIFWGTGKIVHVFFVVFQASTGKKLQEKIMEKISESGDLMLNIPLMRYVLRAQFSYFIYQQAKFKYTAL